MNIEAIRQYIDEHPRGIRLSMVDGTRYDIPHKDFVFFGPPRLSAESRRGIHGTSFIVYVGDPPVMKLVNALLVTEVSPLRKNGKGRKRKGAA